MSYTPQKIKSENKKTVDSINFPIVGHCSPTKICASCCYAKYGPIAWTNSTRKQQYVSEYLLGNDISRLIRECCNCLAVRLNGSGDLLLGHIPNIVSLADACPDTIFWGMTRKPKIAWKLFKLRVNIKMSVTVDASTPRKIWNALKDYCGRLVFGPRRIQDTVPDDPRILTVFPQHAHGRVIKGMPKHKLDCPAVKHDEGACLRCKRCWKW